MSYIHLQNIWNLHPRISLLKIAFLLRLTNNPISTNKSNCIHLVKTVSHICDRGVVQIFLWHVVGLPLIFLISVLYTRWNPKTPLTDIIHLLLSTSACCTPGRIRRPPLLTCDTVWHLRCDLRQRVVHPVESGDSPY